MNRRTNAAPLLRCYFAIKIEPLIRLTPDLADDICDLLLGVSIGMVEKLDKSGELVKNKIGSRVLYPVAHLKRFLEKE